ncbi:MAG: 3-isopropylmalate dehydrogenase [Kiritimatiellae bacterium]|nr:3-isopropylmalate dehydrogenase [Kiritimatiellia bacterium]
MRVKGKAYTYGDDIDTDVIIPARYLNTAEAAELAAHCMEDIDSAFAGRVRCGDILVAGRNFGCGSSREHAPLAIKASGVACVIAESFARIFYRNALNIALPILECPAAARAISAGDEVSVDLETGEIVDTTTGQTFAAEPFPPFMLELIAAGGLANYLGNREGGIVMEVQLAVLPGDGIGPEIVAEAVKVLRAVERRFGHRFEMKECPVGGAAYDLCGDCLPDETLAACKSADAILLGAVGGPKWDRLPVPQRPERRALLTLRAELGLFANLRPAKVWDALKGASPLKEEIVSDGIDMLIVRELTGGAYFGEKGRGDGGRSAYDVTPYSVGEIERVARVAFEAARRRFPQCGGCAGDEAARRRFPQGGRPPTVTSVDKANVLETSRLWRETVTALHAAEYADVELEHLYVDNAAMQLVRAPSRFDVILTENMFGDILSDEASQITGSIGMLPSASVGASGGGLYEPIHGSAPDIAGRGVANPLATILSAAAMLRHAFGLGAEADAVERAVACVLARGLRTADIADKGRASVSTSAMGDAVAEAVGVVV